MVPIGCEEENPFDAVADIFADAFLVRGACRRVSPSS